MTPPIKKILAYVLMILGTVAGLVVEASESFPGPMLWVWLVSAILLFVSGIALYFLSRRKPGNDGEDTKRRSLLFHTGEKVNVEFQLCRIISASSIKSAPEHDDIAVLLAGESLDMIDRAMDDGRPSGTRLHQCVLVFEHEWKGKTRKFISPAIPKDRTTLEFLLAGQKQTTLYIDKTDPANYHFDLLFLG